jgi:hypothetical protein
VARVSESHTARYLRAALEEAELAVTSVGAG